MFSVKLFAFLGLAVAILSFNPNGNMAFAAESTLFMKVKILQCGPREEIKKACSKDKRCCVFVDGYMESAKTAQIENRTNKKTNVTLYQ